MLRPMYVFLENGACANISRKKKMRLEGGFEGSMGAHVRRSLVRRVCPRVSCGNRHLAMWLPLEWHLLLCKITRATAPGTIIKWNGHTIRGSGAVGKSIISSLFRY